MMFLIFVKYPTYVNKERCVLALNIYKLRGIFSTPSNIQDEVLMEKHLMALS